jgi:hypothetical protein
MWLQLQPHLKGWVGVFQAHFLHEELSKITTRVDALQDRQSLPLIGYTSSVTSQSQARVKLNRVFFPR